MGMLIGFPLGVCVNCAAPIARGAYKGGGRVETALSMMISSPTLNVVILTMTFSLFPFYMAIMKVALSVFVVLVVVPILTKWLSSEKKIEVSDKADQDLNQPSIAPFQAGYNESLPTQSLLGGFVWFLKAFGKRLWYMIKTTVPLMLLAGLLGNVLIHYLPWEILGDIGGYNVLGTLLLMSAIAIVGLLLPVPMAFDLIVVAVLMATGIEPLYAMVLLFTLGSFSVYSFFIV
jgi:uncharacterized membrane protein YraQ (UPF0718 family)